MRRKTLAVRGVAAAVLVTQLLVSGPVSALAADGRDPAAVTRPTTVDATLPRLSQQSVGSTSSAGRTSMTTKAQPGDQPGEEHLFEVERTPDGRLVRAGSLLVKFRRDPMQAASDDRHPDARPLSVEPIQPAGAARIRVPVGAVAQSVAAYAARPDVERVEPDYIVTASLTPNDPRYGDQWGLTKIGAPAAWDRVGGASGVRIAILDTGVFGASSSTLAPDGRPGHPDLRERVILEANFIPTAPSADDVWGHGTHVAGTAAAAANNGVGVAGVSFGASILNGKVLADNGVGSISSVARGIIWAADNGAKVINLSLGAPMQCPGTMQDAVDYAWQRGAVLVAAAGNEGVGAPNSPANCNHVLPVGATDRGDERAAFSNYGPAVPIAAPGVSILSTVLGGDYGEKSGTSMATPHVAGVAAAVWASPYGTSNQAVVDRILATADRVAGSGSVWGVGRINAAAAVGSPTTTPPSDPTPPAPAPSPVPSPSPSPVQPPSPPVNPCSPRPQVSITPWQIGPGVLGVRVTAGATGSSGRAATLQEIRIRTATNARVQVGSEPATPAGSILSVPTGVSQFVFTVTRITPGQDTTVAITVVDDCGEWPSFVGGGPAAF